MSASDRDSAAGRALRASEQRLSFALRSGHMGFWECELETGFVSWSPEVFAMTGLTPDELDGTGDDFVRRIHPDDRDRVIRFTEEAIRAERTLDVEFRFVTGDGEVRWLHSMAEVQRDDTAAPSRLIGTMQDVTERRRLVEALRDSEERFRCAVMYAPFPVMLHAEGGEVLTINDAWLDSTGYRRDELPTIRAWTDRACGASSERIAEVIEGLFASGGVCRTGDYPVRTADGQIRVWDFSSAPLGRTADGRRILVSIANDVTARKEAERALRESRERLQAALSASQTGTYRWDFGKSTVEWDDNLYRLWGLQPGPATQRLDAFISGVHPDDRPAVAEACARCAGDGADFRMDLRIFWPDGTLHWLRDHGRTFYDEAGRPAYVTGACIDITRQKTDEIELQRAKDEAERASRAKDDFLATLSHELRTPLTAMLGWSQLLTTPGIRAGLVDQGMKSIERNARAQAQLVEDVLDISRIISGKLAMHPRPMDLSAVVKVAAETLRPTAEAKEITLTLDLAPDAGYLEGDVDRLQQVVANLLSNAVKFTPEGGAVRVALFADEREAVLQVSDNGAGITADFLPLVFDRFQQADASTTRRHGGLGLGLAIVRHVVELHHGTVRADSPGLGRGATFTLRLPRSTSAGGDSGTGGSGVVEASTLAPVSASANVLQGLHVLVVDDELDARTLVATVIESAGARVTAVDSVAGALRVLDDPGGPALDVVISDIAMPDEDGYALLERLRGARGDGRPHLPAVALTAQARGEDRLRALSSGFQRYLSKPVEPIELITVVADLAGCVVRQP